MSFILNATLYWKAIHGGVEPDRIDFIGAFPDEADTPTHYVFQISCGDETSYIIGEVHPNAPFLMREVLDPKEIELIEAMEVPIGEENKGVRNNKDNI